MQSELSGIFRVKLVTKNIVRGSPGTQFMHMRVNKKRNSCTIETKYVNFVIYMFPYTKTKKHYYLYDKDTT